MIGYILPLIIDLPTLFPSNLKFIMSVAVIPIMFTTLTIIVCIGMGILMGINNLFEEHRNQL